MDSEAVSLALVDGVVDADAVSLIDAVMDAVAVWLAPSDDVVDSVGVTVADQLPDGVELLDIDLVLDKLLVALKDGDGNADVQAAAPAALVVPDGHTAPVGDVDPAGQ